jgi:hypothetical protein
MSKLYTLRLTSALAIDGDICRAGSIVEVSEREAKNFLARGKAELIEVEGDEDQAGEGDDLADLSKAQLQKICTAKGLEFKDRDTKDQLIELINSADKEE